MPSIQSLLEEPQQPIKLRCELIREASKQSKNASPHETANEAGIKQFSDDSKDASSKNWHKKSMKSDNSKSSRYHGGGSSEIASDECNITYEDIHSEVMDNIISIRKNSKFRSKNTKNSGRVN